MRRVFLPRGVSLLIVALRCCHVSVSPHLWTRSEGSWGLSQGWRSGAVGSAAGVTMDSHFLSLELSS